MTDYSYGINRMHVSLAYEEVMELSRDNPRLAGRIDHVREYEQKGRFTEWEFVQMAVNFLHMPVQDALRSKNCLLRMFAIVDRRVGKRTLRKIYDAGEWKALPPWLRQFYELRFSVSLNKSHVAEN